MAPALAGFLFVGAAVTWVQTGLPREPIDPLIGLTVAGGALLVAHGIGRRFGDREVEEAVAIGLIVLSFLPILMSHLGILEPTVILTISGILLALFARPTRTAARIRMDFASVTLISMKQITLVLLGILALLWGFLSVLAPPAGMDALTYHLGLPAQYLARGSISIPNSIVYYQYNQMGEMLATLLLSLDSTGRAVGILYFCAYILASTLVGRMAFELARDSHPLIARRAAILAFFAAATIPLTGILAAHTKPDLLATLLFVAAMRRAFGKHYSLQSAALLFGASIAVKITCAYGALPALAMLAWKERRSPEKVCVAALLSALPFAYWIARNFVELGVLLPQASYMAESSAIAAGADISTRLARIAGGFLLFVPSQIDGPLGSLLAAALLFGWRSGGEAARTWSIGVIAIAIWFFSGAGSHAYAPTGVFRFLLPALIGAIPAGAIAASVAYEESRPFGKRLLASALIIGGLVNLGAEISIMERYQRSLQYLSGGITRDALLTNWITTHRIQERAAASLPKNAFVLSIGEPSLFHLRRDAEFEVTGDLPPIYQLIHDSGHDLDKLDAWLREKKYTHILDAPREYAVKMTIGLSPWYPCMEDRELLKRFFRERARLIDADHEHDVFLYELSAQTSWSASSSNPRK